MRKASLFKRRLTLPDEKYGSVLVSQLINKVMTRGEKKLATRLVYQAIDGLNALAKTEGLAAFESAIHNTSPILEVRSKRIGGATYQVPIEVRPERRTALSMRWLIEAARKKQGKPFPTLLAQELFDAFNKTGVAWKRREDTHKMAEANRAFAHYARM